MSKESQTKELPPNTEMQGNSLIHVIEIEAADGSKRTQRRPVASTLEEAKEKRWDFYHEELGWILEGYKLARDRTTASIMADSSVGGRRDPEETTQE